MKRWRGRHFNTSFCFPLSSLCSKLQIQTEMDSAQFLETLAGNFMDVVQYNEDNRAFEVRSDKYYSLSVAARGRGRKGQLVWSRYRSAADLVPPGSVAGSYEES